MSIEEIKNYLELCLGGEKTIPQRKIMLDKKQQQLQEKIKNLQDAIAYIDWKQNFYDEILNGKTKYFSNLTKK